MFIYDKILMRCYIMEYIIFPVLIAIVIVNIIHKIDIYKQAKWELKVEEQKKKILKNKSK